MMWTRKAVDGCSLRSVKELMASLLRLDAVSVSPASKEEIRVA